MGTRYDQDIAAWAQEQAALLKTVHEANLDDAMLQPSQAWTLEQIRTPAFFPD